MTLPARARIALALALLIGAAAVLLFWPGIAMYDTVAQFGQLLSGDVDDWHPPIMVRTWGLLHSLFGGGAQPMLVLQIGLYTAGAGTLCTAPLKIGRTWAARFVALFVASPLMLGWEGVVLKDAQLLGAMLAATGIVARARLRGQPIGLFAGAMTVVLIIYATLLRANAVFATAPFAVMLMPRPSRIAARAVLILVTVGAVLGVSPIINHDLLGARPSDVARSEPLFDLAGMAVRLPPGAVPPFTAEQRAAMIERNCAKPFFWDPLGDEQACGGLLEPVQAIGSRDLMRLLVRSAASHPLAYAAHRLAHWNSTERWLVPPGLPEAAPPESTEPNPIGLSDPRWQSAVRLWMRAAGAQAGTPLGWPILWTAIAIVVAATSAHRTSDLCAQLALALACSALGLEISFLAVSIASDLRYHLWPMMASGLGLILAAPELQMRRSGASIASLLLLVGIVGGGLWTRNALPRAPGSYRAMLTAPAM